MELIWKCLKPNIKTPFTTITSSIIATFFSFSSFIFDNDKLVWILDVALYTLLLNFLLDLICFYLDNQRSTINFNFRSSTHKNNEIYLQSEGDYKKIILTIEITGYTRLIEERFIIYEKHGMTLSFAKLPDYITTENGSSYEIDIKKIIGKPYGERIDLPIRRTIEFDVILDDYENSYSDSLKVSNDKCSRYFYKRKIVQKPIKIKREGK